MGYTLQFYLVLSMFHICLGLNRVPGVFLYEMKKKSDIIK